MKKDNMKVGDVVRMKVDSPLFMNNGYKKALRGVPLLVLRLHEDADFLLSRLDGAPLALPVRCHDWDGNPSSDRSMASFMMHHFERDAFLTAVYRTKQRELASQEG